jgi:hypothetical protein
VITHPAYAWESWAMAVGIDLGMIVTEIATLMRQAAAHYLDAHKRS